MRCFMEVKGKKVLLTGAGSGIGRELAIQLIENGAYVMGVDINEKTLKETKKLCSNPDRFKFQQLDLGSREAVNKFKHDYYDYYDELDIIINNAGIIQPFVNVGELEAGEIDKVMDVNFTGPVKLVKLFLDELLARPEAYIVNVSSMGGFFPFPGQTIYGASKAALKIFTEGLYSELLDTNVKVSVVFPGAIATNITKNSGAETEVEKRSEEKEAKFKALPAPEAARIILKGMEKEKLQIYVGGDSKFMYGLYKFNPQWAIKFISNKMKALK